MTQILLCFFLVACINTSLFAQEDNQSISESPTEGIPSLCINGIIFDQENPLAVVNGDSFRPGDVVEGARIVTIGESSVTFDFKGSVFSQELGEGCGGAKAATHALEKTIEEATRQIHSNIALPKQKTVSPRVQFDREEMTAGLATFGVIFFFILLAYVYSAFTLQLVAKRTSTPHSWLAWIPIGNIFLMSMIAHRPLWWAILLLILPLTVIGIVPWLVMWVIVLMDIAAACGKPKWLAVLTVIPFINAIGWIFFWGYLAFSKTQESADTAVEHIETKSEPPRPAPPPPAPPPPAPPQQPAPPQEPSTDQESGRRPDNTSEDEPPVYEG